MLEIKISGGKYWDENAEIFYDIPGAVLKLEHSLISISKWEAKWKKPFASADKKTYEETIDYIKCMTITPNVSDDIYRCMDDETIDKITAYIEDPMTATWFSDSQMNNSNKRIGSEVVTSELVYYWMFSFNIPIELEKWHFNRLMTLIKIFSIKNQEPKKMSRAELAARNRSLNAQRLKKYKTKG